MQYTLLGRPIKCVVKGNLNGPCVLVQASMHAREYITTPLVIEMMKNYNGNVGTSHYVLIVLYARHLDNAKT